MRISGDDQLGKGCGLGGGLGRSYEASKLFYYPKLFHYSKLPHNYLIPFWSVYCVACRPEDQYDIKEVPLLRGIFQWSDHIFLNLWCSKFAGRVQGYVGSERRDLCTHVDPYLQFHPSFQTRKYLSAEQLEKIYQS